MRFLVGLVTAVLISTLAACGEEAPPPPPEFTYDHESEAPSPSEFDEDGGDTTPDREGAMAELEMDSGATVMLWIDPDDISKVMLQHSDPDDPDAWTEPEVLYEAGDGCLSIGAATDGEVVGLAVDCYADDAFSQDAPDTGIALVSTDLETWDLNDELGEFSCDEPEVTDGEVTFVNDIYEDSVLTWDADDGYDYAD